MVWWLQHLRRHLHIKRTDNPNSASTRHYPTDDSLCHWKHLFQPLTWEMYLRPRRAGLPTWFRIRRIWVLDTDERVNPKYHPSLFSSLVLFVDLMRWRRGNSCCPRALRSLSSSPQTIYSDVSECHQKRWIDRRISHIPRAYRESMAGWLSSFRR